VRYRAGPGNFPGGGERDHRLEFNRADEAFNIQSPTALSLNGGERLVIYNLGQSNADAWAGDNVITPDGMVIAIDRQVRNFAMPGTGIPDFNAHAKRIARAEIYDLQIHHDLILRPMVVDHWKLPELDGLSPEADAARETVLRHLDRVDSAAKKMAIRRDRDRERDEALAAV
jgi:hypothetical protein